MFCPECGNQNPATARFCMKCGSQFVSFDDASSNRQAKQTQPAQPKIIVHQKSSASAVLSFLLLVIVGFGAFVVYQREQQKNKIFGFEVNKDGISASLNLPQSSSSSQSTQQVTTPTKTPKPSSADSSSYNNISSDYTQPMARIRFRRGSIEETISENIGIERSFVLYTLNGQYLSANVSSDNGCVVFANGSTSTNYTTNKGDGYLNLKNNCGGLVSFNLTVNIQ